jgi:hypothetical protein
MRSAGCACSIASPHWQCVWLPPSANPLPFRAATIHNPVKRPPIPNPGNVVHILEHRTGAIRDAFLNDTGTVGAFLRHARAEGHEFEGLEPVRPPPVGLDMRGKTAAEIITADKKQQEKQDGRRALPDPDGPLVSQEMARVTETREKRNAETS